jgi:VIT1/CCC1 family predicted Fe2+/Mn2+ transporter
MDKPDPYFARNLTYGILDAIISVSAVLLGAAFAGLDRRSVLVTGGLMVLSSALSMSFGAALSDEHFEIKMGEGKPSTARKWKSAAVMFLAFLVTGAVVLAPTFLAATPPAAVPGTLAIAAVGVFGIVARYQGGLKALGSAAMAAAILGATIAAGMVAP